MRLRLNRPPSPVGVGDVIRGRFVLEAEVGSGGMGRVFRALDLRRQEALDRHPHVAVKVLTHAFRQHPASLVALQREARRAQTLAHPNIISVFDFDREGSLVYLVMEYLRGRTLNDVVTEPGFAGLGLSAAMQIIRPVCDALTFAHDHGIVHSDLKPSNVFLTDDRRVKVIDFGIARAFQHPEAAAGETTLFDAASLRAFSPLYASPELIDGDEADPRDDVFSLACITYELMSGKHPFGRTSAAVARGRSQPLDRPPGLTGLQWSALRKSLAFSRIDRTATVASFLADLDSRPGRQGLRSPMAKRTAGAATSLADLRRGLIRKHLRLLAAAGALAVALTTGLVWQNQAPTSRDVPKRAAGPADVPLSLVPEAGEAEAATATHPPVNGSDEVPPPIAGNEAAPSLSLSSPDAASETTADRQPAADEAASSPPSPFRDCSQCPEMVVIPAGRFVMGAPATDPDAEPEEKPQRDVVNDKAFALGRYEITEREWEACAEASICSNASPASAPASADLPKTHVSWQGAKTFVGWLSSKTGQSYRLPTEAEWEYAARAGTQGRYPWGQQIGENNANCRACGGPIAGKRTSPVGSFAPNGFGLFDMVGNVWEWTTNCGDKRRDGGAGLTTCAHRIVRGGSWANSASAVRVTQRLSVPADIREDNVGFRVVRDLP